MKKNVLLYTLGTVRTAENTLVSCHNAQPDPNVNKRSQECYDALNQRYNVVAWACGRYGQRAYSKELGEQWRAKMEIFLKQIASMKLQVDFSFQMCGHPTMVQPFPYFILSDFMPWMDISDMDHDAFPVFTKPHPHEQDDLYQKATGIICFTPITRSMVMSYHGVLSDRATVICTGITGHVDQTYTKNPKKMILWVGSDFANKGGGEVISAFQKIREHDPDFTLSMVGVKLDRPQWGVTSYPFLHGDELKILYDLYRDALVFALPSYRECSGLSSLEAMACKTPVITTTRGGLAEIVRKSGCGEVVVPGDVDAIVSAIDRIRQDFTTYSRNAYRFSMDNTRWNIVLDRIEDAVDRWMHNDRPPENYLTF